MNDSDFALKAEQVIYKIAETIEVADPNGELDLDINDGILTIGTKNGVFVINRQSVAREIWLSSPISGPYHFFFNNGRWESRNNDELFNIITEELKIKIEG
jgi:iron donor protein CyaY